MNRVEFMSKLENLLETVPWEEKAEALQYYNDYFDDAGAEQEQTVIEELGSPEKVAANIRKDMLGEGDEPILDTGYKGVSEDRSLIEYEKAGDSDTGEKKKMSSTTITLIIILCVVLSPVILSVLGTLVGLVCGLAGGLIGIICGVGVATLALIAAAIVLLIVAAFCLFGSPMTALALFGCALVCGGLGVLGLMLTVALVGGVVPLIIKGIVALYRAVFKKKERMVQA